PTHVTPLTGSRSTWHEPTGRQSQRMTWNWPLGRRRTIVGTHCSFGFGQGVGLQRRPVGSGAHCGSGWQLHEKSTEPSELVVVVVWLVARGAHSHTHTTCPAALISTWQAPFGKQSRVSTCRPPVGSRRIRVGTHCSVGSGHGVGLQRKPLASGTHGMGEQSH